MFRERQRGKYKKYQWSDMIPALKKKKFRRLPMFRRIHCDCNTVHNRTRWDREILKICFSERDNSSSIEIGSGESNYNRKREKSRRFFNANFPRAGVRHVQQTSVQLNSCNFFLRLVICFF